MSSESRYILVIDSVARRPVPLRDAIEVIAPRQIIFARPDSWRVEAQGRKLAAVFIAEPRNTDELSVLIEDISAHDPNVPVVVVRR